VPAITRRNFLFVGSHNGGHRAAVAYSILASCEMADVNRRSTSRTCFRSSPRHRGRPRRAGDAARGVEGCAHRSCGEVGPPVAAGRGSSARVHPTSALPHGRSPSQDVPARRACQGTVWRMDTSNRRLAEVLDSIQDDFYALDRDWRFTFTSRKFTARIEREPGDFLGRNIWEMFQST